MNFYWGMPVMISFNVLVFGALVAAIVVAEPLAEQNTRDVNVQVAKSTAPGATASDLFIKLKSNASGVRIFCLDIVKQVEIDVTDSTGARVAPKDIPNMFYLGYTNHLSTKSYCTSWRVGNEQTYVLPIARMFYFERAGEYVATIHIKPSSGFTSEELTLKPVVIQVTEAELSRR